MKQSKLLTVAITFSLLSVMLIGCAGQSPASTPAPAPTPAPVPAPTPTPEFVPTPTPPTQPPEETSLPEPTPPPEADIPIIDAHSQVGTNSELGDNWELEVIRLMDQAGITSTILMDRIDTRPEQVISFASKYPGRIVPAFNIIRGGYLHNDAGYYDYLDELANMPQFSAMGEVLMYHAQKPSKDGRDFGEYVIYPDDKRVQVALNYAIERNWPFTVHIEFAAAGTLRDQFMNKFEALLAQHPDHPFVLVHMGELDYVDVRRLIETHPNIHFTTSNTLPPPPSDMDKDVDSTKTNMFDRDRLSADWKQLMIEHPDRFIFALDSHFFEEYKLSYLPEVAVWREAIKELPVEVAHAFAHGNAERLWNLQLVK